MKSPTIFFLLMFGLTVIAFSSEPSRPEFVDEEEATLLRDAAKFFESPHEFRDRLEADMFLVAAFPKGMAEVDVRKKVNEMIERVQLTSREHVSLSITKDHLTKDELTVSFQRVFPVGEDAYVLTLDVWFSFDEHNRLDYRNGLVLGLTSDPYEGPKECIEPKKPN